MTNETNKACCTTDCCGGEKSAAVTRAALDTRGVVDAVKDDAVREKVREKVREGYAKIAQTGSWSALQQASGTPARAGCCGGGGEAKAGGGCCGPATFSPAQLAAAIGYSQSELANAPDASNMGLSCGNPTALASLQAGEVVVDLGSGGGFDCFIAGPKVGASGRVIGVDMTPSMITLSRKNVGSYTKQTGLNNVEFRLGEIENLPIADGSADVLISNCVLNLSPDKGRVWQEIARVLKPGGRVAVSDLALLRPLPAGVLADVEALVGCVSGAVMVEETRAQAVAAGLIEIVLKAKAEYIDAMTNWEDPLYQKIVAALPAGSKPSDYITSLDVSARKAR